MVDPTMCARAPHDGARLLNRRECLLVSGIEASTRVLGHALILASSANFANNADACLGSALSLNGE